MTTKERESKLNIAAAYGKIATGDYTDILDDTDPEWSAHLEMCKVLDIARRALYIMPDYARDMFLDWWTTEWFNTSRDGGVYNAFCLYLLNEEDYNYVDDLRKYYEESEEGVRND